MNLNDFTTSTVTLAPLFGGGIVWLWSQIEKRRKATEDRLDNKIKTCENERQELANRLIAIETTLNGDVPKWIHNSDGIILSVSPEFIRVFAASHGYKSKDIIGKRFEDLTALSPELRGILSEMEKKVLQYRYAYKSNVTIYNGLKATIIKTSMPSSTGDVVYIGYAVPEVY